VRHLDGGDAERAQQPIELTAQAVASSASSAVRGSVYSRSGRGRIATGAPAPRADAGRLRAG